ncbi:MAG: hypothetical protein AAFV88_12270 [Planctomycetota bacterium]
MCLRIAFSVFLMLSAVFSNQAVAQHCAPLTESYLNRVSIEREKGSIQLRLSYLKYGGSAKRAYQAYLLAFKHADRDKVNSQTVQQSIEDKLMVTLATQVIRADKNRLTFPMVWRIDEQALVEKLLTEGHLSKERVKDIGGWKNFDDPLRLAIFIPYLEDSEYSKLDGLPNERHECTYGRSALHFETLSPIWEACFGIVNSRRLPEGKYALQANAPSPPKSND